MGAKRIKIMSNRILTLLAFFSSLLLLAADPMDLSGTWVAKETTPMGEREMAYFFKVDGTKITGHVSMPFGDDPIVEGKITGNQFEFVVVMDFFGQERRLTTKGTIVGSELHLRLERPSRPPGLPPGEGAGLGPGGPGLDGPRPGGLPPDFGGPPPGGEGFGPPPGGGPPGPGRGFGAQELIARRGTPSPQMRGPPLEFRNLPKITLPDVKDLPPNGLAQTPPMGWNSWNKFGTRINDLIIREIADAMVNTGMRDAGYTYINLDDGWEGTRDTNGVIHANTNFPDMKALADYVHSQGLKIGIYSSPGPRTCAGYEGSYGHEEQDAQTWADWGIDYLKYDWCSAGRVFTNRAVMRQAYQKMGEALRATGRPIVFSLCQYGQQKVGEWGPKVGGNLSRTTGDIRDRWNSMAQIGFGQDELAPNAGPGRWNDPDMLEVGNGGMSADEYQAHFSLWAILAAPLIAGNDLRNMTSATKGILLNREIIAIDQDPLGKQGRRLKRTDVSEIWSRELSGGDLAIGLFSKTNADIGIALEWAEFKLPRPSRVRDLWAHADRDAATISLTAKLPPHGVVMLRLQR
jgi:alpha-galactosidase